jgi:hypothetical protein
MSDGLYCFDGAFLFSGNMITATNTTIAMVGDKGFTAAGSGVATMYAPPAKCGVNGYMSGVCPYAIGGLLIWVDPDIKFNVKLTGDADSYFGGTVYHPGGTIEIGGNSTLGSITYGTQLIGDTIKIHGDTDVNIVYDETYYHHNSAKLEVAK